jgi:hypothetical protein
MTGAGVSSTHAGRFKKIHHGPVRPCSPANRLWALFVWRPTTPVNVSVAASTLLVMVGLGVAPKQRGRARQGFQRSAEQAKLGRDRLVLPVGISLDSSSSNGGTNRMETYQEPRATAATTVPSGDVSLMISVLLKSLPPVGSEWSREAREQWMRIFEMTLDNLYKDKPQ